MCPELNGITVEEFMNSFGEKLGEEIGCQEHINLINMSLSNIYRYMSQFDTYTIQEELVVNDNSFTTKYPIKRVVGFYGTGIGGCVTPIVSKCVCEGCNTKCEEGGGEGFNTLDICCDCIEGQSYGKLKMGRTKTGLIIPTGFFAYCSGSKNVTYNIPKSCISTAQISYIPYQSIVKNKNDLIMIPDDLLDILALTMRYIHNINKGLLTNEIIQLGNIIQSFIQQLAENEKKTYDQDLQFRSNA